MSTVLCWGKLGNPARGMLNSVGMKEILKTLKTGEKYYDDSSDLKGLVSQPICHVTILPGTLNKNQEDERFDWACISLGMFNLTNRHHDQPFLIEFHCPPHSSND